MLETENVKAEIQETKDEKWKEDALSLLEVWEKEKLKMLSEMSASERRLFEKRSQKNRKHPS